MVKTNNYGLTRFLDEIFQPFPANWGKDDFEKNWSVPVNIHETSDGFHLEISVPGIKKDDIKLNVEKDTLNILFERQEEETRQDYKTIRREFKVNSFKRSFSLSEKLDGENVKAKYDNGILTVYVPKKAEVKTEPKQITID